jgi:hypothetical protein
LTDADIAYLRWLIQFDTVTQQIVAEQTQTLPSGLAQQDQTRIRAMLRSWEDSRREAAAFNTKASMAAAYTVRLQQMQTQFQNRPVPPNCEAVAAGYRGVLAGFTTAMEFNTRLYRQSAQLIENPRAATQMIPSDMQDGGIAANRKIMAEIQNAKDSTHAALSELSRQFPGQLPADIARFRVR